MCRGIRKAGEENTTQYATACLKEGEAVSCELCSSEASVYCQADDAFLCRKCDIRVHGANFLAQRHIRCLLCGVCKSLTRRFLIGISSEVTLPSVVSLEQRSRRMDEEDTDETNYYRTTVKEPFLFL